MIVCICNALNEARINSAIQAGACTVAEVYNGCAATPRCGKCRTDIGLMLRENSTPDAPPAPSRFEDSFEAQAV